MAAQLDPQDPDVALAVFGKQVEQFLDSEIGSYIKQRVKDEIEEGHRLLADVDPFDGPAVMRAQSKVRVAEMVIGWLAEAIRAGQSSLQVLEEDQ